MYDIIVFASNLELWSYIQLKVLALSSIVALYAPPTRPTFSLQA